MLKKNQVIPRKKSLPKRGTMQSEKRILRITISTSQKPDPKLPDEEKSSASIKNYSPLHPAPQTSHPEPINQQGKTHLHFLCSPRPNQNVAEQLRKIDSLIDRGCDPNATDNQGLSVLHYAVENCSSSVVEKLVDRGATIGFYQMNKSRESPLHLAVKLSRLDTVNSLLKAVVDIDALDATGFSSLHHALIQNDSKIVHSLLAHEADVNVRETKFGFTAAHLSVFSSTPLPLGGKSNVDSTVDESVTPLHLALLESNDEAVKHLISCGADVRKPERIFGFAPIHLTAFAGKSEVDLLASRGCDLNVSTRRGITPLHLSAMLGNVEVVEALVSHEADVYRRDKILGSTALHWAAMAGQTLNLQSLVAGDDAEKTSPMRRYWNRRFARSGKIEFSEMRENDESPAALGTITMRQTGMKVVEVLLERGPVADVADHDGRKFLDLILYSDNVEALEYLLEFGVDVNDREAIDKILRSNGRVRDTWLRHVTKLKAAGLPISGFYNLDFTREFHEDCLQEVNKIQAHEIVSGTSLHDLLHIPPRRRSKFAWKAMSLDLKSRFPEYFGIVWASCREAVERAKLLEKSRVALWTMSGFDLPDLCFECVVEYLSNGQLKGLIDAAKNIQR